MFSGRVPPSLEPNAWARLRAATPRIPFDLTNANPTTCGIAYPDDLLTPLGEPEGLVYRPHPLGLEGARAAVAAYYAERGALVEPERIVLAASTSEAYSLLFKLLCDPGDAVLVPAPSYPLFEHLAALEGVRVVSGPLDEDAGWQPVVDVSVLGGVRAVVVVHPNNPTGSVVLPAYGTRLAEACREAGAALVADEVFLDYPLEAETRFTTFATTRACLTFTLGGLSKSVGLPQLKLAWIVVGGPDDRVAEALRRLEFVTDSYLSVGTPVQLAAGRLLDRGAAVRERILDRCRRNLGALGGAVGGAPGVSTTRPAGGWSAVVRYPAVIDEETLVLDLLEHDGVAVHPGFFFDFPRPGHLVVSLLPEPEVLDGGMALVLARLARSL